jgi:Tol biopolymer transport system component
LIPVLSVSMGIMSTSGCNEFDHELSSDPRDASDAGDASTDTADTGGAPVGCNLTLPFGAAELVRGVASTSEDASMRLSPDEKTAYFFSAQSGNLLLYTATRTGVSDPFENVKVLANINIGDQYNPAITADGLTLFFASIRSDGIGDNDIFQATRSTPTGDFTATRLAPNVNTTSSEVQPYVTHDGTTMYFTQTVGGRARVIRAFGSVAGGFTNPRPLLDIAGPTNDSDPVQSADGLSLFWSSDRTGGMGGLDVWQARRSTASGPFLDAAALGTVNTPGLDAPSDVSEDGCRLYITSTRNDKTGIYVATRPP